MTLNRRALVVVVLILSFFTFFFIVVYWMTVVMLYGLGIITWIIWHSLTPSIAYRIASFRMRKSNKRMFLAQKSNARKFGLLRVIAMSFYPMLFVFGSEIFVMDWIGMLGVSPYDIMLNLFILSFFFLPIASPFIVSTSWIFALSDIRCYDGKKLKIETLDQASYFRYLEDFVGLGAILAFLNVCFKVGNPVYITALFMMLFPVSLLSTSLYLLHSIDKNVQKFLKKLEKSQLLSPSKAIIYFR